MTNMLIHRGLMFMIAALGATVSFAGTISGLVYGLNPDGEKELLSNANVSLSTSKAGTSTDVKGRFSIEKQSLEDAYLVVTHAGYDTDSILVNNSEDHTVEIVLNEGTLLKKVLVVGDYTSALQKKSDSKLEIINKSGLMKMACCNLSESFENSATVTVGFTDAVSGAKQVQLLGLSGLYTQILAENIPTLRGLASTFGWSFVPGSWLESIQLSKGTSSVVNGYEAITSQINLEFKKPNYTEPLFFNFYRDQFGCYEGNVTAATKVAENLWTGLLVSGSVDNKPHDYNGDTFLDMPKRNFINVFNRWFYLKPGGLQSRTGIRFLNESRIGGHDANHNGGGLTGAHYITDIENRNISIENKTGFAVGDRENQSIGIITNLTQHAQDASFGLKEFSGSQTSFYSNVLFTSNFGAAAVHKYSVGGSFVFDNYRTYYQDKLSFNQTPRTALNRLEVVPGLFGEYTYTPSDKLTMILGARTDYNSRYGWLVTPRANVKYAFSPNFVLRGSVGKGYRAPNVISDNIGILASSRKLYVDGIAELDMERSWNYGGNLTVYIPIWAQRKLTLSVDYFHTEFQNQAVVDFERNSNSVFFYNLNGPSFADSWQADVTFTAFKGFDIFAAFKYNHTSITYSDGDQRYTVEKPLTSRYRGLLNLSYATKFKKWVFDCTAQVNGPSRIPWLNGYNSEQKFSPVFPILFTQVTKNTKRVDVYLGTENLLGYKQNNPILNPTNPFDQGFESSFVWGPIVGRKIYIGTRIRIGKLK